MRGCAGGYGLRIKFIDVLSEKGKGPVCAARRDILGLTMLHKDETQVRLMSPAAEHQFDGKVVWPHAVSDRPSQRWSFIM